MENKSIEINTNKKIYTSKLFDTTIIEINEKDNINDFMELDENVFKENPILYCETIYILQYLKYGEEQKAAVSYGLLNKKNGFIIKYSCCTDKGVSGSPVLRLTNNKIIGIHKASCNYHNRNAGKRTN